MRDTGRLDETQAVPPIAGAPAVTLAAPLRALLAAALIAPAIPALAAPEPRPLAARVVWARAERVYVATLDSAALEPGDLLTFVHRRRTVALGEVTQVVPPELAVARLTTGSLARISKLDRVRVLAERPPLRARAMLRVGCPGRERPSLLFDCEDGAPRAPVQGGYRTDSLAAGSYRMVRAGLSAAAPPWPDTIVVRLFADAADQEIAMERGEIDLAVFWPGEPSSHVRADPRWQGVAFGSRGGVVAAIGPAPDARTLAALNEDLFGGDLAPWPDSSGPAPAAGAVRFAVDPSCPGRRTLERFLNRASPPEKAPLVRLFTIDAPAGAPDSLARGVLAHVRAAAPELRARADSLEAEIAGIAAGTDSGAMGRLGGRLRESLGVTLLFSIRCPLLCEPGLRRTVEALGADAFAGLMECGRRGGGP
jgi:hypothetical protein